MKTTKMSRAVMPSMVNARNTLFGGMLLQWMDEVSGIAARRFTESEVTTAAVEHMNFWKPIPLGAFLDVIGEVISVGRTSLRVKVTLLLDGEEDSPAADAIFVYVAIDENGMPKPAGKTL